MNKIVKLVISIGIIAVLAYVALKLVGFAFKVVLPVAILAFIAYIIYVLVTGRKPQY